MKIIRLRAGLSTSLRGERLTGKRVLLIHVNCIPPITGGEYAFFKIFEALKTKYEVTNVSACNIVRFLRSKYFWYVLKPTLILYPLLMRRRYDLIFTSWSRAFPFFGDVTYAQPTAGAMGEEGYRPPPRSRFYFLNAIADAATWHWRKLFSRFSLKYHVFISNSYWTRRLIKRALNKESLVVYPPVPTLPNVDPRQRKENLVVSIGTVIPEKRFELIAQVGPRVPEAKFFLMGALGERGTAIITKIAEGFRNAGLQNNFIYLGRVPERTKREILLKAKVYFSPAINEPFGISIIEGMAAGAIPVAHDSGGPREYLPREWLFKNPGEAEEKIKLALRAWSPTLASRMREIALKFSEEKFKARILEIVDKLITLKEAPRKEKK